MRFIPGGPDIPEELIIARDKGDVVFFCGAGVSQQAASLPNFNRLGITAYGWYAPKIISFGDFDQNTEFGVMLDYEVIRDAALFVGYREIRFELDDAGEDKVDDSIIAGLRLEF